MTSTYSTISRSHKYQKNNKSYSVRSAINLCPSKSSGSVSNQCMHVKILNKWTILVKNNIYYTCILKL